MVFKANYDLKFNDINGDIFILFTRYREDSFDNLNTLKYVTITGSVLDSDYDENMGIIDLKERPKFVIIGGIHVI